MLLQCCSAETKEESAHCCHCAERAARSTSDGSGKKFDSWLTFCRSHGKIERKVKVWPLNFPLASAPLVLARVTSHEAPPLVEEGGKGARCPDGRRRNQSLTKRALLNQIGMVPISFFPTTTWATPGLP